MNDIVAIDAKPNKAAIIAWYARIGACWPKLPAIDQVICDAWFDVLSAVPASAIDTVVREYCKSSSPEPPTPGMIRERADALASKREQERQEKRAWELAREIVSEAPETGGCIDFSAAIERLEKHPEFRQMRHGPMTQSWQLISAVMERLGKKRIVTAAPKGIENLVSEVSNRLGQPKPMTPEEHEARVKFLQKQAYELTVNGKVAVH